MARGQRKTIEEKIAAKEELIEALTTRMESERRELEEMYQENVEKSWRQSVKLSRKRGLSLRKWWKFCSNIWKIGRKRLPERFLLTILTATSIYRNTAIQFV